MLLKYEDQILLFGSCPYLSPDEEVKLKSALSKMNDHENWLTRADNLRISSGIYLNLIKLDLLDLLPTNIKNELELRHRINHHHIDYLHNELHNLLPYLHRELRDLKALKGVQLGLAVYPQKYFRGMRDIDLLIYSEDIPKLKQILIEHGYIQGLLDHERCKVVPLPLEAIRQVENTHYELVHFQKIVPVTNSDIVEHVEPSKLGSRIFTFKGKPFSIISFDVHHNLAPDFQIEDIWGRFENFSLNTATIKGQSYEDLLWFLAARLYHETMLYNFPHLVLFQDMNAILFKYASKIDWDYTLNVATKYDLQPSLFYTLSHLKNTFGRNIPEFVLSRLSPERPDVLRYHEWGDFFPKLFGKCEVSSVEFQI